MKAFLWRITFYVFFVSGLLTIINFYQKAIHTYHTSSQPYRITQNQKNNYGHELSSSSSSSSSSSPAEPGPPPITAMPQGSAPTKYVTPSLSTRPPTIAQSISKQA
mmetsp:Transcript_27187/g.30545  ORF Transcript_27187/g.30545 Transcript_27187/m.30545 type:complete len:106 (-) Transcript_27187:1082-1399(-)